MKSKLELNRQLTDRAQWRSAVTLDNTVWVLGCSFTWGQGVAEELSWPYLLGRSLEMSIANLGVQGSSPLRVWHTYSALINEHRPRAVIFAWPGLVRTYKIMDNQIVNLGPWNMHRDAEYKQQLISGEIEQQNRLLIAHAKQSINVPAVHFTTRSLFANEQFIDLADDGQHPGALSHELISNRVLDMIAKGPAASIYSKLNNK